MLRVRWVGTWTPSTGVRRDVELEGTSYETGQGNTPNVPRFTLQCNWDDARTPILIGCDY